MCGLFALALRKQDLSDKATTLALSPLEPGGPCHRLSKMYRPHLFSLCTWKDPCPDSRQVYTFVLDFCFEILLCSCGWPCTNDPCLGLLSVRVMTVTPCYVCHTCSHSAGATERSPPGPTPPSSTRASGWTATCCILQ